ncbi:MAG: DUF4998 domain-containing protein [Bacteroidales bacterium]|jgi:hypothetical protein|nr:DUF4998 domain-containing protein [Bacteroidales bacterium]
MKRILYSLVALIAVSCGKMGDNIYDQVTGERVYPGMFEIAMPRVGFERVEIDLMQAGRIPASLMKLGSAEKTVVEYDNTVIVIDSLCSWVNIIGLTQQKTYRFYVYTMDKYGNKSVKRTTTAVPYLNEDMELLRIPIPTIDYRVEGESVSADINWPDGLSSVLMYYIGLNYAYTDREGVYRKGDRAGNPLFTVDNLPKGQDVTINMQYDIVPIIINTAIRDTLPLIRPLVIHTPEQ